MTVTLIDQNLELIDQGIRLLRGLPDEAYTAESTPGSQAPAIGPHFRHCLDFYLCFLDGLERGLIDYDARARRPEVERNRATAIARLAAVAERLEGLDRALLGSPIELCSGARGDDAERLGSSVGRELFFLASHTIHHYALIALALWLGGYPVASEFGVAPATLEHWRREGRVAR